MKKKNKKNFNKIGLLGGTFDPPHLGHLYISKLGIRKLKLNKLIWVVTKKNPLKQKPFLSLKLRMKLSKEITKKENKIFVQFLDNKIKSSNTFNLLNYIKNKDKIVVFARQNYSLKAFNSIATKKFKKKDWLYIPGKKVNISSSLIRKF